MLTAGATTSAAFFSLLITDFKGFSEFGFIMGMGYLLCMISMLTVFPTFLVVSERWGLLRGVRKNRNRSGMGRDGPMPFAWTGVSVGLALTWVL